MCVYIYIYIERERDTHTHTFIYIYIYIHRGSGRPGARCRQVRQPGRGACNRSVTIVMIIIIIIIMMITTTIIITIIIVIVGVMVIVIVIVIVIVLSAEPRRATKEGQRVLRTPLHIRTLVSLCSAWFLEPWFRSKTPFPLCHCLVGRCLFCYPGMSVESGWDDRLQTGRRRSSEEC